MMNFIYRLFLAFSATYLIVVVYLIKEKYILTIFEDYPVVLSHILFVVIPIALTYLSFFILPSLAKATIAKTSIIDIELANNTFLPTYLGYFFVSLGVTDIETLIFIFIIIYLFTYLSQTLYFNPLFLLFGFHFYFLTNTDQVKIFLITRKSIKKPQEFDFNNLRRINDFTFIDTEK